MNRTSGQTRRPAPVFLERRSYRARRLRDAARLLPVVGIVLWGVPMLWRTTPGDAVQSSSALIYIFAVWALLIGLALLVAWRLRRTPEGGPE